MEGKVVQGLMGWSDPSIVKCKRYYPPNCRNSVDKLKYLSRSGEFGCVEVDSATYTILNPIHVKSWVESTPKDFLFHFKAFGLFCNEYTETRYLPNDIRASIPNCPPIIKLDQLNIATSQELWDRYNSSVMEAHTAGKLGCVVFQFRTNFVPSERAFRHLIYCSRQLNPLFSIAVDFRNRAWIEASNLSRTISFLSTLRPEGVALVASDDLEAEMGPTYQPALRTHLDSLPLRLPIFLSCLPCPGLAYIRVHRREGHQRVLQEGERIEWVDRILRALRKVRLGEREKERGKEEEEVSREVGLGDSSHSLISPTSPSSSPTPSFLSSPSPSLFSGPIFFLWGTDHEDQPILNSRLMTLALPPEMRLDWKAWLREKEGKRAFFSLTDQVKKTPTSTSSSPCLLLTTPSSSSSSSFSPSSPLISSSIDSIVKSKTPSVVYLVDEEESSNNDDDDNDDDQILSSRKKFKSPSKDKNLGISKSKPVSKSQQITAFFRKSIDR